MKNTTLSRFSGGIWRGHLILIFALQTALPSYSQLTDYGFGAKSQGIGNTNSTLADVWSIFNNIAGMSAVNQGTAFFGYNQYFDIEGFNIIAAGMVQPTDFGNLGLSAIRFGDELYNEQMYSAGFSHKMGFVRLGLRANYYQMHIDEYGTANGFLMDFGGMVELTPEFTLGASVSNFTATRLSDVDKTSLPVIMKLGVYYKPNENISILADLVKDVEYDLQFRAGLEYWLAGKIAVRTGVNAEPFSAFFGLGLLLKQFDVDYALNSRQFLGLSNQMTVAFRYQKSHD